jgi:hypothetical protein
VRLPPARQGRVTVAEAEAAEAAAQRELNADEKAGRLVEFKGKLLRTSGDRARDSERPTLRWTPRSAG